MSFSGDRRSPGLRRLEQNDRRALLIVVVATACARFIPAWLLGAEVSDLSIYRHMAITVLRNQDIYDIPVFFPYTPLSLFLPVLALRLADATGVPFHLTMKLFPFVGDLGSAALVYLVARRRWPTGKATLAGLAFAFNPVSILVTGLHGNIMPLSVFFAFWAYYLVEFGEHRRSYVLSALALGIGIGLRSWPVLLTPLLVRPGKMNWRQRFVYVVVAALPSVAVLMPYMLVNAEGVLREAFDYTSTPDFGWVAIWRHWRFRNIQNFYLPWPKDWVPNSRFYFLRAYGVLVVLAYLRPQVTDSTGWVVAALLLNFTILGGVAAQYFSWIIPFLVLRPYFGTIFSVIAGLAMLSFYMAWHPGIVLGPYQTPFVYTRPQLIRWELYTLTALWTAGLAWLVWFAVQIVRSVMPRQTLPPATVDACTALTAGADSPWVSRGIAVLGSFVALAVAVELPYLARSRPAPEWPAHLAWTMNRRDQDSAHPMTPVGVAAHPSGDIYLADIANAQVRCVSSTGDALNFWPRADAMSPGLVQPSDVTVTTSGVVYVLDSSGVIVRLEEDGSIDPVVDLTSLSAYSPRGLAVDESRRRFYVTDTGKGRVLVVGLDGSLLDAWGGAGKPFSFDLGWGIAIDSHGDVFVAEQGNSRIRKLSPEGAILKEWWTKGDLYDLAVGPDDRIYVSASDRARLWIYNNDGKAVGQIAKPLLEARIPRARGLAVAASGDVALATEATLVKLVVDSYPSQ